MTALLTFGCITAALAPGIAAAASPVRETALDRGVEALLRRMTLEEKVGQMTNADTPRVQLPDT